MPDPLTPLLQFAVPTRGSDVGTWDVPMNGDWLISDNVAGNVTSIVGSGGGTVTLSVAQAQTNVVRVSGLVSTPVTIIFPLQKSYVIDNRTTGPSYISCVGLGGLGNAVGVPQGSRKRIFFDGTNMNWDNDDAQPGALLNVYTPGLPAWMLGFTIAPWLVCDGSTQLTATFPALSALLGGGPTNFTLPDMRGRAMFARDGGTGRLTNFSMTPDGNTLGATGGAEGVALTVAQLAQHSHGITDPGHFHTIPLINVVQGSNVLSSFTTGGTTNTSTATTGITINNTGSGNAHLTVPPAIVSGVTLIKT